MDEGDKWANLSTYVCSTCRFFVPKENDKGRCRRHAPTMDGYPVVYPNDWCGDHKLGTNPSREENKAKQLPDKQLPSWTQQYG